MSVAVLCVSLPLIDLPVSRLVGGPLELSVALIYMSLHYGEPARLGLAVTAGGMLLVWKLLRSGAWFGRDE